MDRVAPTAAAAGKAHLRKMQTRPAAGRDEISALIERIKLGDREAFMCVTKTYQQKVYQVAFAFFRNHEDALDIVQEAFLRVFQKIELFKAGRNFQNWLLQITRNLCIDTYRRKKKNSVDNMAPLNVDNLHLADESSHHFGKNSDIKQIFTQCLEQLSERQRAIFVMKHVNQMKYSEIAQILNVAVGTVKSLNHKAIQNMRGLMSPYLESRS